MKYIMLVTGMVFSTSLLAGSLEVCHDKESAQCEQYIHGYIAGSLDQFQIDQEPKTQSSFLERAYKYRVGTDHRESKEEVITDCKSTLAMNDIIQQVQAVVDAEYANDQQINNTKLNATIRKVLERKLICEP